MTTRMLQRRGLASEWAATNPILGDGEIGFIKDTGELRIGDGVTPFETLTSPYATITGLNGKVSKTGDTMTGILYVRNGIPGIDINPGDASHSGYLEFLLPSGVRGGYLGYMPGGGDISYSNEQGGAHSFQGNIVTSGDIYSSGGSGINDASGRVYSPGNPDTTRVAKTGDTMSGPLTISVPSTDALSLISGIGTSYAAILASASGATVLDHLLVYNLDTGLPCSLYSGPMNDGSGRVYSPGNPDTTRVAKTGDTMSGNLTFTSDASGTVYAMTSGNSGYVTGATTTLKLRGGSSGTIFRDNADTKNLYVLDNVGQLGIHGSSAGLILAGRDNDAQNYVWYVSGNIARLFSGTAGADKLTVDSAGYVTLTGGMTVPGSLVLNGVTQGIEHGAFGTVNQPYFDWHSGAVGVDYDVRLQASGGTGVSGGGTLSLYGHFVVTNGLEVDVNGAGTASQALIIKDTVASQSKSFRVSANTLQLLNNAFSTVLMSVDDNGNVVAYNSVTAPIHSSSGLTGATAASRYVGATASGAPVSGSFLKGDFVIDQTAKIWICTVAGTPGTWVQSGTGGSGGGATIKAVYTDNYNNGTLTNLAGSSNGFTSTFSWTQISNSVTIVCGASGIIAVKASTQLVSNTSTNGVLACVVPAQSTSDAVAACTALNALEGGTGWIYTTGITGYPLSVNSTRVYTGLTPGTSYTFANYGCASATNSISYKGGASTPASGAACFSNIVATTY